MNKRNAWKVAFTICLVALTTDISLEILSAHRMLSVPIFLALFTLTLIAYFIAIIVVSAYGGPASYSEGNLK